MAKGFSILEKYRGVTKYFEAYKLSSDFKLRQVSAFHGYNERLDKCTVVSR